jgi:hypothetical protein
LGEGNIVNINREMEITSINGTIINRFPLLGSNTSFDVSGLAAGIYIYNVFENNSSSSIYRGKLIVY